MIQVKKCGDSVNMAVPFSVEKLEGNKLPSENPNIDGFWDSELKLETMKGEL